MYSENQKFFSRILIMVGDITKTEVEAIVNPTDSYCSGAGGLDYAIHKAAGKELNQALRANRKMEAGQAIMTPAFQLRSASWIIHTVGPKWKTGFCSEEYLLAECYRNALQLAIDNHCESIAFPCISVGANGFPNERASEIALHTVLNMLDSIGPACCVEQILFVCSSESQANLYKTHLKKAIIDAFVRRNAPESGRYPSDIGEYHAYAMLLGALEWGNPACFKKYHDNFAPVDYARLTDEYAVYDWYAQNMDTWDYNTCLAYLISLSRPGYIFYDTGIMPPQVAQYRNGTIRRVLMRMRTLLG